MQSGSINCLKSSYTISPGCILNLMGFTEHGVAEVDGEVRTSFGKEILPVHFAFSILAVLQHLQSVEEPDCIIRSLAR